MDNEHWAMVNGKLPLHGANALLNAEPGNWPLSIGHQPLFIDQWTLGNG
jgi:hypothetical protein